MSNDCCSTESQVMILSCSGGSNVGQLSNQTAIELTQDGVGKMFCLAGIGCHLSGFVQSAKDVDNLVVIDGCSVGCASEILKHADIPMGHHVVITDLGIEKNKNFKLPPEDISTVKNAVCQGLKAGC